MEKNSIVGQLKPFIQPFENELALQEMKALAGVEPISPNSSDDGVIEYSIETEVPVEMLAAKLAYWKSIGTDDRLVTRQILLEVDL